MITKSVRRVWLASAMLLWFSQTPALTGSDHLPPALESMFGGPFSLIDHTNKLRTNEDYLGSYMLITFGYANCPSICPANLMIMADALDRLGDGAKVIVPLFVSIDPGRDRPEVLKHFVTHFGERFVGLTGDETDVREVARAYRVHRHMLVPEDSEPQDYLVDHGPNTFLMGPDGKFRTLFPHGTTSTVMAQRIARYMGER